VRKKEGEARHFALSDQSGTEIGVFTGRSPRQAALKVANRGYTKITLRERGTKKLHLFDGQRVQVDKPKEAPDWMPNKIWKPYVKKIGIQTLE
jgi:Non-histone chromosomal protein MC1